MEEDILLDASTTKPEVVYEDTILQMDEVTATAAIRAIKAEVSKLGVTELDASKTEIKAAESLYKPIETEVYVESDTKGNYEKSGWYYDIQKNNPLTSVRLFANKEWKDDKWVECKNDEHLIHLYTCDAISYEDFTIQISNQWSDIGSDLIGDTVNEVAKNIAPYARFLEKNFSKLRDKNKNIKEDEIKDSTVATTVHNVVNKTGEIYDAMKAIVGGGDDVSKIFNTRLRTQGAQFTYFGGSGVDFGNLGMKFTVFPKYGDPAKNISSEIFITVYEQIEALYPYFLGRLENVSDSEQISKFLKETKLEKLISSEDVKEHFKLEKPPLGYESINKNQDAIQIPGTLELQIGSHYRIKGLVVSSVNLSFSKQMVKNPTVSEDDEKLLSPLYCDVVISLRPSTKYSDKSLKNFVKNVNYSGTNKVLSDNLASTVSNLNNIYLKYV